jgi:Tfp pilus assembly protein PilF/TolB-like protein
MRFLLKLTALLLASVPIFAAEQGATAQEPQAPAGRVVLVLPFDNNSGNPSLDWIGSSFPDTLNKRLNSAGFLTISHDDRSFAFEHLGLPAEFKPSRATTIRIAQQLDANFVVIGSYTVQPGATNGAKVSRIVIQSRVLSLDALTLSRPVEDSAELTRLFDAENAIAWKIAGVLDPHFSASEQTFLRAQTPIPLPAFEDYIRGINASSPTERIKKLQNAVALVPDYAAALLELGKEQYTGRDYEAAATTLAKVPKNDRMALEANFYLGLARFNSANYAGAEEAFAFVASRLPLPEVVNNEGVALSRQNKDAVADFQKASAADPSDEDYHYNLAIALFRRGDVADATTQAEDALKLKSSDNDATALLAQLKSAPPNTHLDQNADNGFGPLERIRRSFSETGFRQAAFQLDQLRAARLSMLPPAQRATEYTELGHQYLDEGLLPEAETQFKDALAADPNSAGAHAGIAELLATTGDAEKARDEAKKSLILSPNVPALLVLAKLDLADNQFASSASYVSEALKLEPKNSNVIALRLVLQQHGQTFQQ